MYNSQYFLLHSLENPQRNLAFHFNLISLWNNAAESFKSFFLSKHLRVVLYFNGSVEAFGSQGVFCHRKWGLTDGDPGASPGYWPVLWSLNESIADHINYILSTAALVLPKEFIDFGRGFLIHKTFKYFLFRNVLSTIDRK